jgi:hypothetical protein
MSENLGVTYTNGTASAQISSLANTKVYGIIVNSHSSGTVRLNDGIGGTTSAGVKATGVLTGSDVFTDGEIVTIEGTTYTMVDELSGLAYEVLIGANLAASLDNLKSAINATEGEGTTYGTGTVAHPNVTATTNTDTAQTVEAYRVGTYGNAITTTTDAENVAWGEEHLENGAEANYLVVNTYTFSAGSQVLTFPSPILFRQGVYLTVGGTINYTVLHA